MENLNLLFVPKEGDTKPTYCSFTPESKEESARLYRAMTNPDHKISDCINQEIDLVDVFVEMVEMTNDESGEVTHVPRCVLFAADGQTYAATSNGICNALRRLIMVFGTPTWIDPIRVAIRQIQIGSRRCYTLDVIC